jgi:ABC-type uncharacterized transport system involved in gliding motility auxiliary subunit
LAWFIALIGSLLLIISGVIYIVNQDWRIYAQIGAGIGLVCVLGAALVRPDAVRTVLAGRPVKYASHAIVKSIAFLGILILINVLALTYREEIDLTETGQFTLSNETVQVLKQLDRPVEVIGFFQRDDPRRRVAQDYLERYCQYTDFLSYEFHNPDLNPRLAKSYNLSDYGLVFVSGDDRHEASTVDEQSITRSLAQVTDLETSISIPTRQPTNRHIWLTPMQLSVTVLTTLIIIPLAIMLTGLVMWWKRR